MSQPAFRDGASLLLDESGRIIFCSVSARTALGARAADLIGRPLLDLTVPDDRLRLARWLAEGAAGSPPPDECSRAVHFRMQRRHGSWVEAVADAGRMGSGLGSLSVSLVLEDASEASAASTAEQLLLASGRIDQLVRSNHELESLASTAAHELKAPLGSLASSVELLSRRAGPLLDELSQELIGELLHRIGAMGQLLDGLLDCSRSGVGLAVEVIDGDALVAAAVQSMGPDLEAAGGSVTVAPIGEMTGDMAQIQSVFRNLLSNALRHRSPDRPLSVWIDAVNGSFERTFTVSDNGRGIDPAVRDRVFGLFERVDRRSPGSGIGLATCRRIVEGHGGRIWIGDGADGGIAVHFTLPGQQTTSDWQRSSSPQARST